MKQYTAKLGDTLADVSSYIKVPLKKLLADGYLIYDNKKVPFAEGNYYGYWRPGAIVCYERKKNAS